MDRVQGEISLHETRDITGSIHIREIHSPEAEGHGILCTSGRSFETTPNIQHREEESQEAYKLAKLLRLGALPEVHLPSRYSDDLRSLVKYRKSLGEIITMLKNRVHAILASAGISIDATDMFGKRRMKCILRSADNLSTSQRFHCDQDQITYLLRK